MSDYTPIDLSKLPAPELIEALSHETIYNEMLAKLVELDPEFTALVDSDPAVKVLQVAAYRELLLRQRINDVACSRMLAYATGADLDHVGADRQPPVTRLEAESDERYRARIALAPEGWSVAGPRGAYEFHAASAHPGIKGVKAKNAGAGVVQVAVLSLEGDGTTNGEILAAVDAVLSDDSVRPLCDVVRVIPARIETYRIEAELTLYDGPDTEVVRQAAEDAATAYAQEQHQIGRDITISGLHAALHQAGVQEVKLISPASRIEIDEGSAAWCSEIVVRSVGVDS